MDNELRGYLKVFDLRMCKANRLIKLLIKINITLLIVQLIMMLLMLLVLVQRY